MITKRIVCLANSRKVNGRCVAGIEVGGRPVKAWVRPVSNREHGEVSEYERQYSDGSDPRVLDVIDVPLLKAQPWTFQTENWLLDPDTYWGRVGSVGWSELGEFVGPAGPLWVNGDSTYNGLNDRVSFQVATSLTSSLTLIHIEKLEIHVFAPGEAFGNSKRRAQGRFANAGANYWLWITDPRYERAYLGRPRDVRAGRVLPHHQPC